MKNILINTLWVFGFFFILTLLLAVFTIILCLTFPTRGFPQPWGPEWGIITVPLALFIDSFIAVASATWVHRNLDKVPAWIKP